MKNVELMVEMLERAGVRWAFGVPSGPVLPLIDALSRSKVQYVLTASETSAGFMASAVGALTGVPGVCISTLGPGATNLATGVGAAWLDRAPVIAITCNVETPWLQRRIQMRIDHNALFAPLTKASFALRREDVAESLATALDLACAEPPGPVHLDLPEDVGVATALGPLSYVKKVTALSQMPIVALEPLRQALARSKRPLLIGGLSLTRARNPQKLVEFIEAQGLPFVLTLHAKGFLPESHANYAGVIGRARRSDVQAFISQADLIIAVGYDPIEINYEEWAGATPIIHLSSELAETSEAMNLAANVAGDIDSIIAGLNALPPSTNEWTPETFAAHRELVNCALRPAGAFSPSNVLDALRSQLPDDAILAYDVGAHTHQIATQWRTNEPNTCISTNGWSSMGYGIPAAYAAKLVHPELPVVGVIGDGCFQMTAGELSVGRRLGLAAPIVVLNDGWLSLLKVKQERKGYELSGVYLGDRVESPPHYFGVPCRGVRSAEELSDALAWALDLDGPSVIEAFIDGSQYLQTVYD